MQIVWVNKQNESGQPYDIMMVPLDAGYDLEEMNSRQEAIRAGIVTYVEVKCTTELRFSRFNNVKAHMSTHELDMARALGDHYWAFCLVIGKTR
jgi:hypothetical protein